MLLKALLSPSPFQLPPRLDRRKSRAPSPMRQCRMTQTVRAGVIGFGLAGRVFHASVIHETPGLELAAIVERSGNEAVRAFPDAHIVRSVDDLLADTSIDLVVVATPNDSHVPLARQCLEAGRNVVIDKPFAVASADAAALAGVAHARGLTLSAFHNRRWDGDFLTLQALLSSGTLGHVVSFESHFDRFRPLPRLEVWRENGGPGGGILFDLGPHLIDQALVLFGDPSSIWATVRTERAGARADDAFDLHLRYAEQGLSVWLRATMSAVSPAPRFVIHGNGLDTPDGPAGASFVKWGLDPQEAALKRGETFATPGFGYEPEDQWGVLTTNAGARPIETERGDYRRYYQGVREAILERKPPPVSAADAWKVLRLIELARESSESERTQAVHLASAPL